MARPIAAFVASSTAPFPAPTGNVCFTRTMGDIDLHLHPFADLPERPEVTAAERESGDPTWRFYLYALIMLLVSFGVMLIISVFGPPPINQGPANPVPGSPSGDMGKQG